MPRWPGGRWWRNEAGEGPGRNSGTKLFRSGESVIRGSTTNNRTRAEKHRKGGNKSVATNMSLARLFIGQEGQDVTSARIWPGHCFEREDTVFSCTSRELASAIGPCNVVTSFSTICKVRGTFDCLDVQER